MCDFSRGGPRVAWSAGYGRFVPRIPRSALGEYGVFHVTQNGTGGISVFVDDMDRERFRLLLSRTAAMFEWELHAWCLMGTHYHLLIQGPREQVSAGMHRLAGLYAQGFNCR
jgi:REP element-mobilizing transposase RayT